MALRLATPAEVKKREEFRCIERVALAMGIKASPEAGQWPDGWLEDSAGIRQPVEVVAAFQRRRDEDPRDGAAWMKAFKQAERDAEEIERTTGAPAAFGAHYDSPFAVPLDGQSLIPPAPGPNVSEDWVAAAVRQKIEKRYSLATKTILVVDLRSPFNLERFQLARLAAHLGELGSPFIQIWIVNAYGDLPQLVPMP